MSCMCDFLYSVGIHCICELFFFNYPIVSHCTKFLFQKGCEFEVIYILFLPWLKEGFASRKTIEEEKLCVERAVPKSTRYKISG